MIQTPFLAVDGIIELFDHEKAFTGIVLIERKNPPHGWAFPGGFVDIGEDVAHALKREMREEISLDVEIIRLQGIYSNPSRDSRFHTASAVFVCRAVGIPTAADDAKAAHVFSKEEAMKVSFVFDHQMILDDYLKGRTCVFS